MTMQKTLRMLVLTFLVLGIFNAAAKACFFPGISKVPNPEETIKNAFFIGIVEVLWMKELDEKGLVEAFVRPVQTYKSHKEFRGQNMKIMGRGGTLSTYCNGNAVIQEGTRYIEVVIDSEQAIEVRQGQYQPLVFDYTTSSLGRSHWTPLRENSIEADEIKALRLGCLKNGGKWHGSLTKADWTQSFWCYPPE